MENVEKAVDKLLNEEIGDLEGYLRQVESDLRGISERVAEAGRAASDQELSTVTDGIARSIEMVAGEISDSVDEVRYQQRERPSVAGRRPA